MSNYLNLHDIIHRAPTPAPWAEGEKIPWNEPEFSRRMLQEHLSQSHDLASRRSTIIDQHVAWINQEILQGKKANILDLGCGPGLYSQRMAAQGHTCTGIDFSPASIGYAQENSHPNARFIEGDVRTTPFSPGYTLVMMLYGEFNVFTPADAHRILQKAYAALITGGIVLLEAHTFDCVRRLGQTPPTWYSAARGVFSDEPYLCLMENFWHAAQNVAVERFYVLDAASGAVSRYSQSIQAYENEAYTRLLEGIGYTGIHLYPSLTGGDVEGSNDLLVITARKPTLTR